MHDRVERHFAALRHAVDRGRRRGLRHHGRRHRRRVHRRPTPPSQAAIAAQRGMPATRARRCAWASTPARSSASATTSAAARSTGPRASWPSATAGQILLSDVAAALVRSGTGRGRAHRPRHPSAARPRPSRSGCGRWSTPTCAAAVPARARRSTRTPTTCRPQRSSLVGRDRRRPAARRADRARHRIVTLTGVGGVGKTRLAVHAAADLLTRFATVWFVELACVTDPDDVADTDRPHRRRRRMRSPIRWPRPPPCSPGSARCSCSTTASTSSTARRRADRRAHRRRAPSCRSWPPVARRWARRRARARRSRPLDPATDGRSSCSASGPRPPAPSSPRWTGRDGRALCRRLDGIPLAIELAAARAATLGRRRHRRRARRPVQPAAAAAAGGPTTATAPCGPRSSGRTGCSTPTSSACSAGSPCSRTASSSTPRSTSPARSASTSRRPREHVDSLAHKSMIVARAARRTACATGCWRPCGRSPLEQLDAHGERLAALTALAEWVTTITDLPFADPCSADGRAQLDPAGAGGRQLARRRRARGAPALRRAGRPAVRTAGRLLPARPPRPRRRRPAAARAVRRRPAHRRAVLCALSSRPPARPIRSQLRAWADEMQAFDELEPTGLGGLMRWLGAGVAAATSSPPSRCASRRRSTSGSARAPATCSSASRPRPLQPHRRHGRPARA